MAKKKATAEQRGQDNIIPHQWKPGESGNPKGAPRAKTNLYRYICEYLEMGSKELASVKVKNLSLVRQAAYNTAVKMDWKRQQEIINRDEGKVPDRIAGPEGEALKFYAGIDQEKL